MYAALHIKDTDLHVTLGYFGKEDNPAFTKIVANTLLQAAPTYDFNVYTSGRMVFDLPDNRYAVGYLVDRNNTTVATMREALEKNFKKLLEREELGRAYTPHITTDYLSETELRKFRFLPNPRTSFRVDYLYIENDNKDLVLRYNFEPTFLIGESDD